MPVEQDVRRLDVAMDVFLRMNEIQRTLETSISQPLSEWGGMGLNSPSGPVNIRSFRLPPARNCMTTKGCPCNSPASITFTM